MNHIYYVDTVFKAACNATIEPDEHMWHTDRQKYRPEILNVVKDFLETEPGRHLHLGEIKPRHSKTVDTSYMSFGCYKCDSIFGDFYVRQLENQMVYGYGKGPVIDRLIKL